jgi:hypothetical protein
MEQRTQIFVKTQFVGYHSWKDAPDEVGFLRNEHRQDFHVKAIIPVSHEDRQLEFFMVKNRMDSFIAHNLSGLDMSCETFASTIGLWLVNLYHLPSVIVEVDEDGTNGASVLIRSEDENVSGWKFSPVV